MECMYKVHCIFNCIVFHSDEMVSARLRNNLPNHLHFHKSIVLLADLKNQPIGSSCVTHILPFYGYFKGQEHTVFNPTSWHLVTYNF